jgi:DNA recombination protein RmuC
MEIVLGILLVVFVVLFLLTAILFVREKGQNGGAKEVNKELKKQLERAQNELDQELEIRKNESDIKHKKELEDADKESKVLQTLAPVAENLKKMQAKVEELEGERKQQYGALDESLKKQHQQTEDVRKATNALSQAMKTNQVRGQWGETQLRTIVEATGMLEHVNFETQVAANDNKPDMIINLPGDRAIVIDSKVPASAYLEASEIPTIADEAEENRRQELLKKHAEDVKKQVTELAKKTGYFDGSVTESTSGKSSAAKVKREQVDFVILFIPSEAMLSAALDNDPTLLEYAFGKRIALASPVSLFSVLKTVQHIWQQDAISQNAIEVGKIAVGLIDNVKDLLGHSNGLAKSLNESVKHYNSFSTNLASHVLLRVEEMSKSLNLPSLEEASFNKADDNKGFLKAAGPVIQISNSADEEDTAAEKRIQTIEKRLGS